MADDLDLKITIPKADDKAFITSMDVMLRKLDQVEKKMRQVDKVAKGIGSGGGTNSSGKRGPSIGTVAPVVPVIPKAPVVPQVPKTNAISKGAAAISILGTAAGGAGGRIATLTGRIGSLTAAMGPLGVVVAIALAAFIALIVVVVKSVKAFSEFEASLGAVARVAQLNNEEMEAFGKTVLDISANLPVTTAEVFKFADALANAGLRGKELDDATLAFSKLGTVVKNLDTSKVQDILRLKQLSGTADSIESVNDKILKLSQNVVATVPQITKAASQTAAAFAGTGANLDDILSIGATAAGQTKKTQRLVTSLGKVRQALAALNTIPDENLQDILDTLRDGEEISVKAFRALAAGPGGVTKAFDKLLEDSNDLRGALDGLGLSAASTGNTLVRSFSEQATLLAKARRAIEGTNAAGTVDEQANKRLKEFSAQMTILGNQIKGTFVRLGAGFAAILKPAISFFTTIVRGFNEAIDTSVEFFKGLKDAIPDVAKDILNTIIVPLEKVTALITEVGKEAAKESKRSSQILAAEAAQGVAGLADRIKAEISDLGDVRLIGIEGFNDEFIARINTLRSDLLASGNATKDIDTAIKSVANVVENITGPEFDRMAKNSDIIAQNLNTAEKTLEKLVEEQKKLDFDLEIVDLTGLEKTLAKIKNDTKIKLDKNTFDFSAAEADIKTKLSKIGKVTGAQISFDPKELDNTITKLKELRANQSGNRSQATLDLINLIETFSKNKDFVAAIKALGNTKIKLAIDREFVTTLQEADKELLALRQINLSPLAKQLEDLDVIINKTFATDKLKRANIFKAQVNITKTFATELKKSTEDVQKLQNKLKDFDDFELKGIFDTSGTDLQKSIRSGLASFNTGLRQVTRDTKSALEKITLSPENRVNAGVEAIQLEAKLRESILKKDKLQRLALIKEEFKRRVEIIKADRENILSTQASSVASVTDAGSALESVNQIQRDAELQDELLEVNELQLRELVKQTKKATEKVVFPTAR